MTDTPTATPASWIPTFESIRGISWMSIAKWAVAALAILLAYTGYNNMGIVTEYLKPAPAPMVVDHTADLKRLTEDIASLRGESRDALAKLTDRVGAIEAARAKKR